MDFEQILKYARDLALPVVILIFIVSLAFKLYFQEKRERQKTNERLIELYRRLEERLYHELDELEKLLREERAKLR